METSCGRVNFIVLTLSKNRHRTESFITSILEKFDGRLLPSGFNNRFFVQVGIVHVKTKILKEHSTSDQTKSVFVEIVTHPTEESRQKKTRMTVQKLSSVVAMEELKISHLKKI